MNITMEKSTLIDTTMIFPEALLKQSQIGSTATQVRADIASAALEIIGISSKSGEEETAERVARRLDGCQALGNLVLCREFVAKASNDKTNNNNKKAGEKVLCKMTEVIK